MWSGRSWWFSVLVAELGAFALWAFFVNRVLIQWEDQPAKTGTIAVFGLVLAALAAVSVSHKDRRGPLRAWLLLLALFGLGEVYRGWLRYHYRSDSRGTPLWPVVTTNQLEVRRFTVDWPSLGAARVRIAHLTDLHARDTTPAAYFEDVKRALEQADPDILVFTGDFVSHADRLPALERWLSALPRARLGSYAVLGNHDYWTGQPDAVRSSLTRAGIEVIGGRCVEVRVPGARSLELCGIESPWGPDYVRRENMGAAATIALSHTPDNVYALEQRGVAAVFSGHTHAGQFRVPFAGAVIIPSDYGRRFDEGHFEVGRTHLFVSAGVGADAPPLRLWCRPELLVVDWVGSESGALAADSRAGDAEGAPR